MLPALLALFILGLIALLRRRMDRQRNARRYRRQHPRYLDLTALRSIDLDRHLPNLQSSLTPESSRHRPAVADETLRDCLHDPLVQIAIALILFDILLAAAFQHLS